MRRDCSSHFFSFFWLVFLGLKSCGVVPPSELRRQTPSCPPSRYSSFFEMSSVDAILERSEQALFTRSATSVSRRWNSITGATTDPRIGQIWPSRRGEPLYRFKHASFHHYSQTARPPTRRLAATSESTSPKVGIPVIEGLVCSQVLRRRCPDPCRLQDPGTRRQSP